MTEFDELVNKLKRNGLLLKYARSEFKKNILVILEAVNENTQALKFANNATIVKYSANIAMSVGVQILHFIKRKDYENNFELFQVLVSQNGMNLCYASINLRANHKLSYAAIKQNGMALAFCLNHNEKILQTALNNNGMALQYVPYNVKTNALIKMAVRENPEAALFRGKKVRFA